MACGIVHLKVIFEITVPVKQHQLKPFAPPTTQVISEIRVPAIENIGIFLILGENFSDEIFSFV